MSVGLIRRARGSGGPREELSGCMLTMELERAKAVTKATEAEANLSEIEVRVIETEAKAMKQYLASEEY